jgi:hypothetical protein
MGAIEVVNLFAWRATKPKLLDTVEDPVGLENDKHICDAARQASRIVLAWGKSLPKRHHQRDTDVIRMLYMSEDIFGKPLDLHVLGVPAEPPLPRHPLYLRADAPLELWRPA